MYSKQKEHLFMSIKIVYVQINKKITESFFNPVILIYTKLWMVPYCYYNSCQFYIIKFKAYNIT